MSLDFIQKQKGFKFSVMFVHVEVSRIKMQPSTYALLAYFLKTMSYPTAGVWINTGCNHENVH